LAMAQPDSTVKWVLYVPAGDTACTGRLRGVLHNWPMATPLHTMLDLAEGQQATAPTHEPLRGNLGRFFAFLGVEIRRC
jgi:hypothetical protein